MMNPKDRLQKSKNNLKIAMVTIPDLGHFIPMLRIGEELAKRGHQVTYITPSYAFNDRKLLTEQIGCNCICTQDSLKDRDLMPTKQSMKNHTQNVKQWAEHLSKMISDLKFDVLVGDFMTFSAALCADHLKIPYVINQPGPISLLELLGLNLSNSKFQFRFFGFLCQYESLFIFLIRRLVRFTVQSEIFHTHISQFFRRTVLVNTFWGFEDPIMLPPNFIVTGPLVKSNENLLQDLQKKDQQLYDWMNQKNDKGEQIDIVYISLGSIVIWTDWEVKAIYNGLKSLNCKVIWSIKQKEVIVEDQYKDKFWIRNWLPQIEILAHPSIKAGLCHCGFGGVLEFINAGVPMICHPHFGDQFSNADLVENKKIGIRIHNKYVNQTMDDFEMIEQKFTADDVFSKFKEVIQNPIYNENIKKMQVQAMATGGTSLAADSIQTAYFCQDNGHLVDKQFMVKQEGISIVQAGVSILSILGIFGAVYSGVFSKYYTTLQ